MAPFRLHFAPLGCLGRLFSSLGLGSSLQDVRVNTIVFGIVRSRFDDYYSSVKVHHHIEQTYKKTKHLTMNVNDFS